MEVSLQENFLGTGWSFPPSFDYRHRGTTMVSAIEDIDQSLIILLSTMKNERVMLPDFGTDLIKLVFEEMDNSLYNFIIDLIKNAILLHEPRVDVEKIDLTSEMEKILVSVEYVVRSTNSRHNLVYPFYINQGTSIEAYDRIY